MRKAILVSVGAAALALGLSNPAQAAMFMSLTDGVTTVSCTVGGACDPGFFNVANTLGFIGQVGQYAVNINTQSSNNPGTASIAELDSSSTLVHRTVFTGASTLTILMSQTGFTAPVTGPASLGNSGTATDSAALAGDSYSVQSWVDTSNALHNTLPPFPGTTTNGPCTITSAGGTLGSGHCDGSGAAPGNGAFVLFANSTPFSLTQVTKYTLSSLGGVNDAVSASGGTTVTAVPEPASMLLLGTGLIGLAARARRSLRKS